MIDIAINEFIEALHKELNKQTEIFLELKRAAKNRNILFTKSEYNKLTKINSEKEQLLNLIKNHNKRLIEFQKVWLQRKNQFSPELQKTIYQKIEELREIVSEILELERQSTQGTVIKTQKSTQKT
ncbi:MAG: hypothetical protein ACE5HX_02970 [bacterium]